MRNSTFSLCGGEVERAGIAHLGVEGRRSIVVTV